MWVYLPCFGLCISLMLAPIHAVRTICCDKQWERMSQVIQRYGVIMFYPFLSPRCRLYKLKVLLFHIKSTEYIKDCNFKQKHKRIIIQ